MRVACLIQSSVVAMALAALAGCAGGVRESPAKTAAPQSPAVTHEGRPLQVDPADSLLTLRVYRGGSLARIGHNHLVASRELAGTVYVPEDLTHGSFELRFPVATLTVDDASLRSLEGPDFSAEVPDSAREGTRRNMLGESLLDAERFPEIVLVSEGLDVVAPNELLAHVRVTVRDHTVSVVVPVHHELDADGLLATGEFALKQSDLGLTPFSVMMGAMQVQDEMKVRFRIHCR